MCLESCDGSISGTVHCNWRQRVADSWCLDAECLGCLSPADREVVDWRISEYELVVEHVNSDGVYTEW